MCSKHFKETEYQIERKDSNKNRKHDSNRLQRKFLHPDAVPSIFPNLPEHYSKTVPERRSETTSKESRFQRQYEAAELEAEIFLAADKVESLEELEEKLDNEETWPKDIMRLKGENKLTFYNIAENELGQPVVRYSLIITEDLKFIMWCKEVKVPLIKVSHICKDKKINSSSGVLNIIAFLKNFYEEKVTPP